MMMLNILPPDIAVGAPYEDDMSGAVYIYNGYNDGLWPTFTQRILASDISPGLRGFGVSIANAADINSDNIKGKLSFNSYSQTRQRKDETKKTVIFTRPLPRHTHTHKE